MIPPLPGVFNLREPVPKVGYARGRNSLAVFAMGSGPFRAESVAADLALRPDPHQVGHGFVEPDRVIGLTGYRTALAATRGSWNVDEGL